MSDRLANAEAIGPDDTPEPVAGLATADPPWIRARQLVFRQSSTAPPVGSAVAVESRPAVFEVPAYSWRKDFGHWQFDSFTGAHGVIFKFGVPAQQEAGGMNPWDMSRRTLRSGPTDAWDAGTAVGRAVI